jgi:Flp pilus assembly protein TadG
MPRKTTDFIINGIQSLRFQSRAGGRPNGILMAKRVRKIPQLIRSRGFVRSDEGSRAVEFALVATPFLALLVAIIQTIVVFLAQRVLDQVVSEASRTIQTGQAQTSGLTQAQFTSWVCQKTVILFSCGNFMVNVQNYDAFGSASMTTPTLTFDSGGNVTNSWNYQFGSPGDIVVVQVMYQWPLVLGPLGFTLANLSNGNRLLVSSNVFKREPS